LFGRGLYCGFISPISFFYHGILLVFSSTGWVLILVFKCRICHKW
jgi:hypothetical protein